MLPKLTSPKPNEIAYRNVVRQIKNWMGSSGTVLCSISTVQRSAECDGKIICLAHLFLKLVAWLSKTIPTIFSLNFLFWQRV